MDKIIIGVYRSNNPIEASGPERLEAALKEAEKNNIRLVFFDDNSIIFSQNMVEGIYFKNGKRKNIRTYIPEVIINPLPSDAQKRTSIEKTLRGMSRFTSYAVLNKYDVAKKLEESEEFSKYAIESIDVKNYEDIFDFLDKHGQVVLKPIMGRQGDRIYFIYREKQRIIVKDYLENIRFTEAQFKMFIDEQIRSGRFLVQPYIEARTKDGEPYDFRVHLHRDKKGEWAVVKSYPRIGHKKSILSNISKGGRTQAIEEFLDYEFGTEGQRIKKEIEELAIGLSDYINSFYRHKINEIGVDIAIDKEGNYWTYELNGAPQSKYHNEERAKYVIEYTKYLYDEYKKERIEKELKYIGTELLKVENKLLNKDFEDEIYIGILTHPNLEENFNLACGQVGLENDVNVFYFYESDIDYKAKSINGRYYNRLDLERRKYTYPDVILDRLRMRGFENYERVYNEFKNIPFNNERDGDSVDKTYGYSLLENNKELRKYIIPYIETQNVDETLEFLKKYKTIVLKPNLGSHGHGLVKIKRLQDSYRYIQDKSKEKMNLQTLKNRLKNLYKISYLNQVYIKSNYKDGRPFDARVHMAKGENGRWNLIKIYAKVGAKNKVTSNSTQGGYIGLLEPILKYKFGQEWKKIYERIINISYKWNEEIEKNIDKNISEIAYDVAITDDGEFYLFEINLNRPFSDLFTWDLAKNLIPYCIYLAKENQKNKATEFDS